MTNTLKKWLAILTLLLSIMIIFTGVSAQDDSEVQYSAENLQALVSNMSQYMEKNQSLIEEKASDDEQKLFSYAFTEAWGISRYDNATPQQIETAYKALLNASVFMGMVTEWGDKYLTDKASAETLFLCAFQELDQDYYDLLTQIGQPDDKIKEAEKARDDIEALYEDETNTTSQYSKDEREDILKRAYKEVYTAATLKASSLADQLPSIEKMFPDQKVSTEGDLSNSGAALPNPMEEQENSQALSKAIGFSMPEFSESSGCQAQKYYVIGGNLAQINYDCGGNAVTLRAAAGDADPSGVYGYSDEGYWTIANTYVGIGEYENLELATWGMEQDDQTIHSFSIVAENTRDRDFLKGLVMDVMHKVLSYSGEVANPMKEYENAEPLSKAIGFSMPEFSESTGCKANKYYMIGDDLAQINYDCEGKAVTLRGAAGDFDPSGIYGYSATGHWAVGNSSVEVGQYDNLELATWGSEQTDHSVRSFSIVIDDCQDRDLLKKLVKDTAEQISR